MGCEHGAPGVGGSLLRKWVPGSEGLSLPLGKSLSLCKSPFPRLQTGIRVPGIQGLDEEAELRAWRSESA